MTSPLPTGWSRTTIGDLATVSRGASPRPIASPRWFSDTSDVAWVRIADLGRSDGLTLRRTTQRLSADGVARSRLLPPGTLIMSIAATVGLPIVTGIPACIHDGFVALQRLNGVDRTFLLYALKSLEPELRGAGQTGSQANVNTDIVNATPVLLPSEPEQRAIAEALVDADHQISVVQRLITKKDAIKQGLMQQLLTGEIRLPGHTEPWLEARLGAVTTWLSGGTPDRSNAAYWDGAIPWISAASLKNTRVHDSPQRITEAGLRAGSKLAPKGSTLVLVRGMALHREARIGLATRPVSFNQDVKALVPQPGLLPEFLLYALRGRSQKILDLVSSAGSGTGVLDTGLLKKLSIGLPDAGEQRAIIRLLRDADYELDAQREQLRKARSIKHGMTQQLLTGRTRLAPAEAIA